MTGLLAEERSGYSPPSDASIRYITTQFDAGRCRDACQLGRMQDYTKLLVWQRARTLTVVINEVSRGFRPGAAPGLRSQLMRAAMSISATVAEGAGRDSRADFARFITMAIASASEVEHHLHVAADLGLLEEPVLGRALGRCIEVRRMLFGLQKALLLADAGEQHGGTRGSAPSAAPAPCSTTR